MSQDLRSAVDWKSVCSACPGSFTLFTEAGVSEAGFLLSYALSEHLNRCYRDGTATTACFVAIAQIRDHYEQVGIKLGVNLNRCVEQGRLVFVEGLRATRDLIASMVEAAGDDIQDTPERFPCLFNDPDESEDGLRHLYDQVKSAVLQVKSRHDAAKSLLIVDDVTLLLNIGIPIKEIVGFVEYCRRLAASVGASLIALAHGSIQSSPDDEDDMEKTSLCRFLAHRSDIVIGIADLASGNSKDVSGEMIVLHRPSRKPSNQVEASDSLKRWHFKVEDKRVVVFAPGLSSAVI